MQLGFVSAILGDLTLEESMCSIDLFAERVQPALEEVPA